MQALVLLRKIVFAFSHFWYFNGCFTCLYLSECISNGDFKYGHEIPKYRLFISTPGKVLCHIYPLTCSICILHNMYRRRLKYCTPVVYFHSISPDLLNNPVELDVFLYTLWSIHISKTSWYCTSVLNVKLTFIRELNFI